MPPHMGEYGMGEEHKDDGYGGPEMGSWQMPGRFLLSSFASRWEGFFTVTVNSPSFSNPIFSIFKTVVFI